MKLIFQRELLLFLFAHVKSIHKRKSHLFFKKTCDIKDTLNGFHNFKNKEQNYL